MCVICISDKGMRTPTREEFLNMWNANPHGAGYMFSNGDRVEIHKGFMDFNDFYRDVCKNNFDDETAVVYHFRISTQAGVNPQMTQPFGLTSTLEHTKKLDLLANVGIAHNGIIQLTSNGDKEYSDTALFISEYMTRLIRCIKDVHDEYTKNIIQELIDSKMAIMDRFGDIETIGDFQEIDGLRFSNNYFLPKYNTSWVYPYPKGKNYKCNSKS